MSAIADLSELSLRGAHPVPNAELAVRERNNRSPPVYKKRRESYLPAFRVFRLCRNELRRSVRRRQDLYSEHAFQGSERYRHGTFRGPEILK